jgi:hypothetical protein
MIQYPRAAPTAYELGGIVSGAKPLPVSARAHAPDINHFKIRHWQARASMKGAPSGYPQLGYKPPHDVRDTYRIFTFRSFDARIESKMKLPKQDPESANEFVFSIFWHTIIFQKDQNDTAKAFGVVHTQSAEGYSRAGAKLLDGTGLQLQYSAILDDDTPHEIDQDPVLVGIAPSTNIVYFAIPSPLLSQTKPIPFSRIEKATWGFNRRTIEGVHDLAYRIYPNP